MCFACNIEELWNKALAQICPNARVEKQNPINSGRFCLQEQPNRKSKRHRDVDSREALCDWIGMLVPQALVFQQLYHSCHLQSALEINIVPCDLGICFSDSEATMMAWPLIS